MVDQGIDDAGLKAVVDDIKNKLGGDTLDAATATTYAGTAIKLLGKLAADHASIYRVDDAGIVLRDALKDKRQEIATGAAMVLGQLSEPADQQALAAMAVQTDADPVIRQANFVALADSAKRLGNNLDTPTVSKIVSIVSTEGDVSVRQAAAQALGGAESGRQSGLDADLEAGQAIRMSRQ